LSANSDLLQRRNAVIPRGISTFAPVFAARAQNAEIWDVEDRRYIDFAGGIAVLNVGHRHPKVMAAVQAQLECFTHTAFQVMAYEPYIALAERLSALAPFSGVAKSILFTTGAEAVENAVKIARGATRRSAVIAFTGAFHGRTLLGSALTGKVSPYKRAYGPAVPDIYHLPFPVEHYGTTVEDSLKALSFLFTADVPPERVAAIIIEPVQGEGGFHVAPAELIRALRRICDEHGILLISDEVQSGFARTGRMFGIEHSGVEPDLVAVAKSLAGGFPLSGVIGRAAIMDALDPGGLGGTYGGSPIACAAALAVLDVIEEEGLLKRADTVGAQLRVGIERMSRMNHLAPIAHLRGPGAMIGFDIVKVRGGSEPDGELARKVTARALDRGLLVLNAGQFSETIRILVPLTASDAIIDEGLSYLQDALDIGTA
jgi:4-aminobutyrate aminotransferase / (S)-3-amino-2-methylpropionate transaminase / 5-aminovalerate transaminase